jgi:hypothetical protein
MAPPDTPAPPDVAEIEGEPGPLPPGSTPVSPPAPVAKPPAPIPPATVTMVRARCRCGRMFNFDPDGGDRRCTSCNAIIGPPGSYRIYAPTVQFVHLVDAEMPFGSMCWLIFKWTCATIPTVFVFGMIYSFILAMASGAK